MTSNNELLSLAERVEKGSGEDRRLDVEVAIEVGAIVMLQIQDTNFAYWMKSDAEVPGSPCFAVSLAPFDIWPSSNNVPRYTASLDAVVALIEERLPAWQVYGFTNEWTGIKRPGNGVEVRAWVRRGVHSYVIAEAKAATNARALLAATLRAIAEEHDIAIQEPTP